MTKKKSKVRQSDGWMNVVTGLGTRKDKNTYSEVSWAPLTQVYCENLYAGDEMAQKVAKIIPYDGTREGISWNMDESSDQKKVMKYLEQEYTRLKIWSTLAWGWTVARTYGGACILINVKGGSQKLETPLKLESIQQVESLRVFDRFSLDIQNSDLESDLSSPRFGEPNFYTYQSKMVAGKGGENIRIHHSRLIRLDGVHLPENLLIRNSYWHDSIYGALSQSIRNYSITHDAIATIISDFNQPVYRIQGLSEAIAMDEENLITKKLQIVDLMRSTARAIVLDKEDEFENVSTNVAGGKELIDLTVQRLVAGSDIPHTRLLGNSPTGLGATGKSELINYYDSVKSMQNTTLRDPLQKLTDLIFSQSDSIERPEDLTFQFNPLFQQDLEIEIKTRKLQAEIDGLYIERGVITAQEVADSRFATGKYSFETVIEANTNRISSFDLQVETTKATSLAAEESEGDSGEDPDEDISDL